MTGVDAWNVSSTCGFLIRKRIEMRELICAALLLFSACPASVRGDLPEFGDGWYVAVPTKNSVRLAL